MGKANVLIAEDDPLLRGIYEKKFTTAGFAIDTASDGEEAIAKIEAKAPDVLLLDLNMPKVDGFQVLEKFPKDKRSFPVIVLTNYDQMTMADRGQQLGADGYFVKKDTTIRSLVQMVEEILSHRIQGSGETQA